MDDLERGRSMGLKLKETESTKETVHETMEDSASMDEYNQAIKELDEKIHGMEKRKQSIEDFTYAMHTGDCSELGEKKLKAFRSAFDISDNSVIKYILCGLLVFLAMLIFSKAQREYIESKVESVTLPAVITDVKKDERISKVNGRNRWVTDYIYTYEWEDEEGNTVVGVRTSSDYIFEEGQEVTVTVLANDYTQEIDSSESAKRNMAIYIFMGIGILGVATLLFIKGKQKE